MVDEKISAIAEINAIDKDELVKEISEGEARQEELEAQLEESNKELDAEDIKEATEKITKVETRKKPTRNVNVKYESSPDMFWWKLGVVALLVAVVILTIVLFII